MRRLLSLVLVALFAGSAVALAAGHSHHRAHQHRRAVSGGADPVLLGDTHVEAVRDGGYGTSEAFGYTATVTGTATDAEVYLTSTGGVRIGLYADKGICGEVACNQPGARLDRGTVTSNAAGWVDVKLNAGVQITQGARYWLAIASYNGHRVSYRDNGSSGSNLDWSLNGLSNPASPIAQWNSNPASVYLNGTTTTSSSSTTTTPTTSTTTTTTPTTSTTSTTPTTSTTSTTTTSSTTTTPPPPPPTTGLRVSGNQLINPADTPVVLHGTFETGPSYACEQNGGYGFSDTPIGDSLYQPMVAWKINSNAIYLNQDCWLGINGVGSTYGGQNYRDFVKAQVASMEAHGIYPVLVFGEGAPGNQQPNWNATDTGEAPMPDNDHMPLAVQQLASAFKSDPDVILRLYPEPWPNGNGTDLSTWKCWSRGDVQYDASGSLTPVSQNQNCSETYNGAAYKTVGMQSLVNIIRGTGATNIIQVPGVAFANMLACQAAGSPTQCGFLDSADGVKVNDTLTPAQLVADTDNYPDAGQYCQDSSCLSGSYDAVRQVMPLDMGEVGVFSGNDASFPLVEQFVKQYDTWGQSYYGSQWESWANLIRDYNGTPHSGWGQWFHDDITGGQPPPVTTTTTTTPTTSTTSSTTTSSTTSAPPPPTALASMTHISPGLPEFSSPGQSQCGGFFQNTLNGDTSSLLNNNDYTQKSGTCFGYQSTTAFPSWVAYNLSSLPAVAMGQLKTILSNFEDGYNYNYDFAQDNTGDVGSMRNYTIDVACQDPTVATPPADWTNKLTVNGNTLRSRSDLISMTDASGVACNNNYNWIRINATSGNQWDHFQVKWNLWDASQNHDNSWMFYGDSITNVWNPQIQNAWSGDPGTFAQQIHAWNANYFPSFENGATGGKTAWGYTTYLASHDGGLYQGGDSTPWLPKTAAHFVSLALGTNDCNGAGEGSQFPVYMGQLVDEVLAADPGRVVILPHIQASPALRSGTNTVNVSGTPTSITGNGLGPVCNQQIDQVIKDKQAQYGASHVVAGPDLWAATVVPSSNWGDSLHPAGDAQGIGLYNDAWVQWAEAHVFQ